jgi:chloramphenicol-sensitive protein RarD
VGRVSEERRGVAFGVAAYLLWGMFPLYWPLLQPATPPEILAHRIVWSLLVVVGLLAVRRNWGWLRGLGRRRLGLLTLAAVVISVNWATYIHGVNSDHVVETSLGYFINPLVTVLLGVVVLRETLRPVQWGAIGLAALAVVVLTVDYGRPPWIALVLAVSFAAYGLLKKKAGVGALEALTVETAVLVLPALAFIGVLSARGAAAFGASGTGHAALIAGSGVVTAVPLLCFGAAANRVPLSTLGLLQYLAPVLQFLIGVLVFREQMPASRWVGFVLVWTALVVLSADGLRSVRRRQLALAAEPVA